MASLKGSRTDQSLREAFSDARRINRRSPSGTQEAIVARRPSLAAQSHAAVDHNGGHLDFLAAGYDTSPPLGSTVARLTTAIAAMTDDQTAMRAGVARTVHDEGIADRFETVAITGHSHAGEMRRALDNMR